MKSTKNLFLVFIRTFIPSQISYSQKNNTNNLVYDPELNQMVVKNTSSTERTLRVKPDGEDFIIFRMH